MLNKCITKLAINVVTLILLIGVAWISTLGLMYYEVELAMSLDDGVYFTTIGLMLPFVACLVGAFAYGFFECILNIYKGILSIRKILRVTRHYARKTLNQL